MKTALVHEWFECFAGSERVVAGMRPLFDDPDLFALVDFLPDEQRAWLGTKSITTSFLQKLPWARRAFRNYLPLMPTAIEQFDLSGYDLVVSSSHAFAKGVITRADQMHVSYVHTPIRYAWDLQHEYLRQAGGGLKRSFIKATLHYLRMWDRLAADRVDAFIANSRYIAQRIRKTYRRPAFVIHPPVDVDAFQLQEDKQDFYLTASRLVPYKRTDVVVDAFRQMPDKQLIVIGDGPELERLEGNSPPNVRFLGYQSFESLRTHMQQARAFVFAADEDFGIMPVEAQACGTPVIALGRGGSLETVVGDETGIHFDRQCAQSVADAVREFESKRTSFRPDVIRAHAEKFRPERFQQELQRLIDRLWTDFGRSRVPAADHSLTAFPLDPRPRLPERRWPTIDWLPKMADHQPSLDLVGRRPMAACVNTDVNRIGLT